MSQKQNYFNRQRNLLPAPQNPQPGWSFPNRAVLDCPWANSREVKELVVQQGCCGGPAHPPSALPMPCPDGVGCELVRRGGAVGPQILLDPEPSPRGHLGAQLWGRAGSFLRDLPRRSPSYVGA